MSATTETKPKTIYQKIAVIQSTIGAIEKTQTNDHFRSRYFDVNDLAAKLLPLLAEQNILMTMPVVAGSTERNIIRLILRDLDTDQEETVASAYLPEGLTIQQLGGAITYLRRYLPVSYFYLQAEDDDGNIASHPIKVHGNTGDFSLSQAAKAQGYKSGAELKRTEKFQKHQGDDIPVINMDEDTII